MFSPDRFGKFTAETNIRLQKAFLVSFSIAFFIALTGDLLNQAVNLFYDLADTPENQRNILEEKKKRQIIIFAQYLMLFVIAQYTFNYIFASISYFGKFYKWRSIWTLGLFPLGKVTLDWILPVGLAFYVLYLVNDSDACKDCLLGSEDKIASDFSSLWNWSVTYVGDKIDVIYPIIEPVVDIYKDKIFPFVVGAFELLISLITGELEPTSTEEIQAPSQKPSLLPNVPVVPLDEFPEPAQPQHEQTSEPSENEFVCKWFGWAVGWSGACR